MVNERLNTIIKAVNNSSVTLDVGTDHGYVAINLIKENRAKYVIASDINEGPLLNAKRNIINSGLEDKIELRLGFGLETVKKNEADLCIIAGMGGILISEIIKKSIETARAFKYLILQPMNSQDYLRKFLINNDFCIDSEYLAFEREKTYNIIKVIPKKQEPYKKEVYYQFGQPDLFNSDGNDFYKYINIKINNLRKIINNLSNAKKDVGVELEFYKDLLEELLCLQSKK